MERPKRVLFGGLRTTDKSFCKYVDNLEKYTEYLESALAEKPTSEPPKALDLLEVMPCLLFEINKRKEGVYSYGYETEKELDIARDELRCLNVVVSILNKA